MRQHRAQQFNINMQNRISSFLLHARPNHIMFSCDNTECCNIGIIQIQMAFLRRHISGSTLFCRFSCRRDDRLFLEFFGEMNDVLCRIDGYTTFVLRIKHPESV